LSSRAAPSCQCGLASRAAEERREASRKVEPALSQLRLDKGGTWPPPAREGAKPDVRLAPVDVTGMRLVEMTTEQAAADAAGNGAENSAADGVTDKCATHTACDRADCTISAAAAVPMIAAVAVIIRAVMMAIAVR